MKRHTEQTFISEEETEGEEFERSPSNPPDYRGQRGLPFRNRANRHWDAEAHDPHEPRITQFSQLNCQTSDFLSCLIQCFSNIVITDIVTNSLL